jgi:hypothetical protein
MPGQPPQQLGRGPDLASGAPHQRRRHVGDDRLQVRA